MPNTKEAGDITEAVVLAEFLRAGFPVALLDQLLSRRHAA